MKGDSRTTLWKRLGCFPKNPQWSWCAANDKEKKVIFQVWKDHFEPDKNRYLFMSRDWTRDSSKDMGFNDALEKITLLNKEYQLLVTFATAVDPKLSPRKTKCINDTLYSECSWEQEEGNWYCKIIRNLSY